MSPSTTSMRCRGRFCIYPRHHSLRSRSDCLGGSKRIRADKAECPLRRRGSRFRRAGRPARGAGARPSHRQAEAARAGAARVHVEHVVLRFDRRLGASGRRPRRRNRPRARLEVEIVEDVQRVDPDARRSPPPPSAATGRPMPTAVDVAAHDGQRVRAPRSDGKESRACRHPPRARCGPRRGARRAPAGASRPCVSAIRPTGGQNGGSSGSNGGTDGDSGGTAARGASVRPSVAWKNVPRERSSSRTTGHGGNERRNVLPYRFVIRRGSSTGEHARGPRGCGSGGRAPA